MGTPEDQDPPGGLRIPEWDARSVLRQRAAAARAERDSAITDLRDSLPDEEILVEFGINLSQIEG